MLGLKTVWRLIRNTRVKPLPNTRENHPELAGYLSFSRKWAITVNCLTLFCMWLWVFMASVPEVSEIASITFVGVSIFILWWRMKKHKEDKETTLMVANTHRLIMGKNRQLDKMK